MRNWKPRAGLPIMICSEAVHVARQRAAGWVNTSSGEITIDGKLFGTQPLPLIVQQIVQQGGLVPWVKREVQRRRGGDAA